MNDHNLDDLIIDTETPKQSKPKNFLTIIALLIIVLIITIVMTKIFLIEPSIKKPAYVDDPSEFNSPELTLQDVDEDVQEDESDLSKMIESEISAPPKKKTAVETVKQETVSIDEEQEKHAVATEETTEEMSAPKSESKMITASISPLVLVPAQHSEPKGKNISSKKENVTTPSDTNTNPTPQKKSTAPVKTDTKPAPKIQKPALHTPAYYIQVGSFSKSANAYSIIKTIKKLGYHHTLNTTPNGMKKVLIGPYRNRKEADKAIIHIKVRINKHAFVVTK